MPQIAPLIPPSAIAVDKAAEGKAIGNLVFAYPLVLLPELLPHCSQKKYVAWRALKKYHDHDKGGGSWPWKTGDLYVEKLVT